MLPQPGQNGNTFQKRIGMDYELINNKTRSQYEFHIEGFIPVVEYIKTGEKIYLTHTKVPEQLAGRGIASLLVKKLLEDIRKEDLKLIPLCPFVAKYIKRHPEWEFLVLKS